MTGIARLGGGVRRVALGLIIAASLGAAGWRARGWPAFAAGKPADRQPNDRHRDVELSVVESAEPDDARRGHTADGDPAEHLRDRAAGRAQQQRWLPRHERRSGDPGHVQRTRQWRERRVLHQRHEHRHRRCRRRGCRGRATFTANGTAGGYTVTASSRYGSVSFALTNTAAGIPARLVAVPPKQIASVAAAKRRRSR